MKEREWAFAAFPEETTVLRLRLRPYSCGHEITLCQIGSPYVTGENSPSIIDLKMAVLICSQSFESGRKILTNSDGGGWQVRLWSWLTRNEKLIDHELAFRNYQFAGSWSPQTVQNRAPGVTFRQLKAPRAYRLIPFLCRNLGLTEIEALNFPIARAHAYYAAEADREGTLELASEEGDNTTEGRLLAHLKELEERAKKGEPVWDF